MAFPTLVRVASAVSSTTNAISYTPAWTFTTNTAISAGELVRWVAFIAADGFANLTSSNWTVKRSDNGGGSLGVAGAICVTETSTAFAAGASPALTVQTADGSSEQFSGTLYAYKASSGKVFGELLSSAAVSGTATNANPPSITNGSGASQDVVAHAVRWGDSTVVATAAPTNYTNHVSRAGGGTNGASTNSATRNITLANAASEDPGTFTNASEQQIADTFGIYEYSQASVGSSDGAATVSGAGKASSTGSGSVSGAATVTASAAVTATGAGSASGAAAVSGAGGTGLTGAGTADGAASVSGAGAIGITVAGSAAGAAAVAGAAASSSLGSGSVDGSATAIGQGVLLAETSGAATAAGTADGSGIASVQADGGATGSATVSGSAVVEITASGSAAAFADAAGAGLAVARADGSAAGTAEVQGEGAASEAGTANGSSSGSAQALGQGMAAAQAEGMAEATAAANGEGWTYRTGAGLSAGFGVAVGIGSAIAEAVGLAAAAATANGEGASIGGVSPVTPVERTAVAGDETRAEQIEGDNGTVTVTPSSRIAAVTGEGRRAA